MRKLILILALIVPFVSYAEDPMLAKARRAYANSEWASADALYGVYASRSSELRPEAFSRMIVAEGALGDSVKSVETLRTALNAEIPQKELLAAFRSEAFAAGMPELFPQILIKAKTAMPWLSRPFDAELLDYFRFRNNPAETIIYARKMIAGLPENTSYRMILADALVMEGREEEAEAEYLHILEIDPDNFDALVTLGTRALSQGRTEAARDYLTRARALRPTPALDKTLKKL